MTYSASRRTFLGDMCRFTAALPVVEWPRQMAQQRVPRIGFMSGAEPSLISSFEAEMRALGYTEGGNIHIEMRLARPNTNDTAAHAMVSNGFAESLERPGGIYTGLDELPPGVTRRRLELLKRAAPALSRIALLSTTPGHGGHETQLADAEQASKDLGFSVKAYRAGSVSEITAALEAIKADRMEGLLNFQGGLSLANRQLIVDFATAQRIPAVYQSAFFVESGGLMAWAPDQLEQYRVGARLADQILKGRKPGEIPVRYPEPYQLHLNTKAAASIGLILPPELVAAADRIVS